MALFGSSENETTLLTKTIRPTVLRVQNVAKELLSISKSYEVSVNTIDFNVLEVQTYTRMYDGSSETEWEEISEQEIAELDDATALLNPHFQIKQMYEIEFFSKKIEDNPYINFNLAVGANATKCKVYLSIKEGAQVSYSSRFDNDLVVLINKAKLRAGILINIFDEMMDEAISKITAHVRIEEDVTFNKTENYLIAQSYEPTLTINDDLIFHYDKKEELNDNQKTDYASRGFIQSVQKGELLIEYIKAKLGQPGRNCRGAFMEPKEPIISHEPTFTTDDTIRKEDTPTSIKYIANEKGYIAIEGSEYSIKNEVDVGEISFKTTGNITSGIDSDVTISVTEKDAEKDAIGTGMEVEVSEIEIDGNVGSNAKLTALRATIGGQTHKTAILKADKLDINVHKGEAYGKHIHITRLEHGKVDGDIVDIKQAIGGNIRANEITIEICTSHVKATASKLIEINKLQGSENVFTIDPVLKKSAQKGLKDNTTNIRELEREVRKIKEEVQKYKKLVDEGMRDHKDIKKRLMHYKKNGVKMPSSFVKKYKQFQKIQEHFKLNKEFYAKKSDQLELLTTKTSSFQDNIFDARIINHGKWIGYNELVFKLVDPVREVVFKPKDGSTDKVFALVENSDGQYEIKAVDN